MSKIGDHRIYKHLSEPMRLVGLTLDELIVGGGGFFGSLMLFEDQVSGSIGMAGSLLAVLLLKRLKKSVSGRMIRSYLYWQGFWPRPSPSYPPFDQKEYRL